MIKMAFYLAIKGGIHSNSKKAILQNDTTYSIFIENLRQKIEKNYSLNLIINRYNLMYQEIIDKYSKI